MHDASVSYAPMSDDDLEWVLANEVELHAFPWTRGNFTDSFKAGYYTRVMRMDGELVAYVVMLWVMDEAHLLNIGVNVRWQGKGVATMFMRYLISEALAGGIKHMYLEVRPSNIVAQKLYRKMGFQLLGRRKNYYPAPQGGREDALVMGLDF